MNNNNAYMHGYCSSFVCLHVFASTNVSDFLVKMCKIKHFFFVLQTFATTDAVTLMYLGFHSQKASQVEK